METLYKLDKLRDLLHDDHNLEFLDDKATVSALLYLFSQCLTDNLKLAEAVKSLADFSTCTEFCFLKCFFASTKKCTINPLDLCVPQQNVFGLLKLLAKLLKDNCVFMEVLCRNALRTVELASGTTGCATTGTLRNLVPYVGIVVNQDVSEDFSSFLDSVSCLGDYSGLCGFAKSLRTEGVLFLLALCGFSNHVPAFDDRDHHDHDSHRRHQPY